MNQDIIAQSAINTRLEMYEINVIHLRLQMMNEEIIRKQNELRDLRESFTRLKKELKPLKVIA
tara:strand:- start:248 stop:436 length:189 start_codon:yes stop_codon:yes gene_type:complete